MLARHQVWQTKAHRLYAKPPSRKLIHDRSVAGQQAEREDATEGSAHHLIGNIGQGGRGLLAGVVSPPLLGQGPLAACRSLCWRLLKGPRVVGSSAGVGRMLHHGQVMGAAVMRGPLGLVQVGMQCAPPGLCLQGCLLPADEGGQWGPVMLGHQGPLCSPVHVAVPQLAPERLWKGHQPGRAALVVCRQDQAQGGMRILAAHLAASCYAGQEQDGGVVRCNPAGTCPSL